MVGLEAEVAEVIARMRAIGTDLASVEAKAAAGGMPRSVPESLSAFSNTEGGLLLLGVAEEDGFSVATIDAPKLASDLASLCSDSLEPPIWPEIDIVVIDGQPVVAAHVEELPADRKPCYVKTRGMDRGSYRRSHDGDRGLTSYEVHVLVASRGQPVEDMTSVASARIDELDPALTDALVKRLRDTRGRVFASEAPERVLDMVGVTATVEGTSRPTLAGLLSLGRYPQQFFPQLNLTFVAYPTPTGEPLANGTRFLDNQSIDGPIPTVVAETLTALRRNMKRRSIVVGLGREDVWEYPEEAVRELVTNALVHRDYHPLAHGTQVRVELYPDRLEIISPGGLHGPVSRDDLLAEPVSSSRNALLAKLLEDVAIPGTDQRVCENRASGLLATAAALRRAGMEPPKLVDKVREFRVTIFNHGLLDGDAVQWLSTIDTTGLSDSQRLGLAFARRTGAITNQQYRTVTGSDALTATRDLTSMAGRGLLTKSNDRRWARWTLVGASDLVPRQPTLAWDGPGKAGRRDRRPGIRALLADGPRSTEQISSELGITREAILRWLRRMEADGEVRPTQAARKSRYNRWELTA